VTSSSSRTRTILLALLLVVVASALWLERWSRGLGRAVEEKLRENGVRTLDERRRAVWSSGRYDETGFVRLEAPREGEWLARFHEPGETFDEYRSRCSNKRRPGRETIALRPFGPLSPRARAELGTLVRFTEVFFALPVRLLDERPLPANAFLADRKQFDVPPLLDDLKRETAPDELVHAGIADQDLCWPSAGLKNFVFGGASLSDRVGVYSVVRFGWGEPREPTYRVRAMKLLAHELGHILSLPHCIYYRCVMNGANSQVESDATPCHLCPVCREKLEWNLGWNRPARARALAEIFRAEGIEDEARWNETPRSGVSNSEGER
jgi:archaemetzincin